MSFSNQQTRASSILDNLANTRMFPSLDRMTSNFDRSILGIPNEHDEFSRDLTLSTDGNIGRPSLPAMSEESGAACESPPYDPSQSSNNTSSQIVFTPQSISDTSGGPHLQITPSRSGGSPGAGLSDQGSYGEQSPSLSARASAGAAQAAPSPTPSQTPTHLCLAGVSTPTMTSLSSDERMSDLFGLSEPITASRTPITLNVDDLRYLEEEMARSQVENLARPSSQMDAQVDQRAPPLSEVTHASEASHGNGPQRRRDNRSNLVIRTRGALRSRPTRTRQQLVERSAVEKAKAIEHARLMREIGSCLPCLVNHEHVSIHRGSSFLHQRVC